MSKLDELFKEKLSEHLIMPSNGSWEKVEAGLSKKNNTVLWLRWAAIFLLGAFVLGAILMQRNDTTPTMAKENESHDEKTESQPDDKPDHNERQDEDHNKIAPVATEEKLAVDKSASNKKDKIKKPSKVPPTYTVAAEEKESINATPTEEKTSSLAETTVANVTSSNEKLKETNKPIVLVYTLDAVQPVVETPSAEVASNDKKDSSLKRVMNFAKDVKNGENPFGIREMKDELFALELKKKTTSKNQ